MINRVFEDQGEFIDRGKPLAEIVNVDRVKLNVHAPELDVRYLRPGQKVGVRIDAFPDRALTGIIRAAVKGRNPRNEKSRAR